MNIKSICIVGGGSSGWLMATALQKQCPKIKVTLIESPDVPTIGVGESTIPYTTYFINDYLGLNEKEWMSYCDATYKASIRFNDFRKHGETLYHPFWTDEEASYNGFDWAIRRELTNLDKPSIDNYYSTNFIAYHMSQENKFSKLEGEGFSYAHHLDSVKLAEFCKNKFTGTHLLATVTDVLLDKNKNISSVHTDKEIVKADLFVDCTGFKSLLIDGVYKEQFESISDTMLNDRALMCRISYKDKHKELEPFTDCTALSSGWVWNVPLWSRIGTGYVYSSKFQTDESAKKEFKQYLKNKFGQDRVNNVEIKSLKIKAGKYKNGWVQNCLSLVLASGFIEPLESTALAMTAYQIESFIEAIQTENKSYAYSAFNRAIYNKKIDTLHNEVHNFVLTHYVNSTRTDSKYWKYIAEEMPIPSSLLDNLDRTSLGLWFPEKSWECILLGFQINSKWSPTNLTWDQVVLKSLNAVEVKEVMSKLNYLTDIQKNKLTQIKNIPLLYDYLNTRIFE
jgi:hypothetical protein